MGGLAERGRRLKWTDARAAEGRPWLTAIGGSETVSIGGATPEDREGQVPRGGETRVRRVGGEIRLSRGWMMSRCSVGDAAGEEAGSGEGASPSKAEANSR
ncbi:uncharacterized protein A4U43_C04F16660 [Asparagus officinalis]|uniref:Uncharacterized protein n=1 Tax=Asparagus officinalis TaxID=4686 RepID=A0A5P1F1F4_ASPOF|nr:uncharacterized protein A4U43_C04F16660 [Asparagus officinalis]